MFAEQEWTGFDLGTPANYRIKIRGHLDEAWAAQKGLTLSRASAGEHTPITILSGEMIDQAALFGVLQSLYSFGFPLLSVECIPLTNHLRRK
jgi:hypothetical protein